MIKPSHRKIVIIGNAGSGKTTLALQIQEKLQLPLYHLDQYQWKPHWEKRDLEEFHAIHNDLLEQEAWIIEGLALKVLRHRVLCADVVIFLDISRSRCIYNVFKRLIANYGKVIPGNSEDCKQWFNFKFFTFLKWICDFNKRHRNLVVDTLDQFKDKKQIYILKSPKEMDDFIKQITKDI
ncbi:MAG: topology modulation protein [Candidatus Dependentiae bacterium]|nr:topology modulation protein [Candidatus Dependentiae bacterium]